MKRISRKIRILSILFALFFLLSGCTTLSNLGANKSGDAETVSIAASIAKDGSAWIPCKQFAPAIHIKGDIREAYLSADRSRVVVLEESGELYTAKPTQLDKRTSIAQNVDSILTFRDDGLVYSAAPSGAETVSYRYMFRDTEPEQIDMENFVVADDTASLLYSTPDGAVMLFGADDASPVSLDQFSGTIDLTAVSDDAALCVLSVTDSGTSTIYLYDEGERQKLDSVDSQYGNTHVDFSKDEQLMVVTNTNGKFAYLKKPGEDAVEIELPMELGWNDPMTANGPIRETNATDSVYLSVQTEDYGLTDLFLVNLDGEREKVLGNVREAITMDGRIYYTDGDYTLYGADLDGANYSNENKISSNVYSLMAAPDGKSLCYSKNVTENNVGSLYIYSPAKDESTRATTNASFLFIDLSSINSYFIYDYERFSSDGKYLYYFEDIADVGDGSYSTGSLMRFCPANGETNTVLVDSMIYIGSERADGAVLPSFFWVEQYFSSDSTQISCDLLLYKDSEKVSLAQNILHKIDD